MAVVVPSEKSESVAMALRASLSAVKRQSDGYLATLIGISYLKHADPVQAIEWAKVGAQRLADPMPLYVAHAAEVLWKSRDNKPKSRIRLEESFPELERLFTYFKEPENTAFLDRAERRFDADLNTTTPPWSILRAYLSMLDRSNPDDLELIAGHVHRAAEEAGAEASAPERSSDGETHPCRA